jgi:hypothetical protein
LTCSCGERSSFRRATPKQLLTTVGHIEVPRRYYACRHCRAKRTPWDEWSGTDALRVTPHARKMIVTVSCAWSFDRASRKLKDLCHMNVSDDTIERVCQHEGERARKWLRGGEQTAALFEKAPGEAEFYSDGLKVNTTEGWREMRLNLLQKRERAMPVGPEQWKDRACFRRQACGWPVARSPTADWSARCGNAGANNWVWRTPRH